MTVAACFSKQPLSLDMLPTVLDRLLQRRDSQRVRIYPSKGCESEERPLWMSPWNVSETCVSLTRQLERGQISYVDLSFGLTL